MIRRGWAGGAIPPRGMAGDGGHPAVAAERPAVGIGSPAARRPAAVAPLLAAVVVAALVRALVGGARPAASAPAALIFAVILLAVWMAAARTPPQPGRRSPGWAAVAVGAAGGGALVALSLLGLPALVVRAQAPLSSLLWWMPLVTLVAVAEELALRGALFESVSRRGGDAVAVLVTAALFALIHLPLYGPGALAVDLAAGVFLGTLRVLTGGVTAPAVAHAVADLATGWLA